MRSRVSWPLVMQSNTPEKYTEWLKDKTNQLPEEMRERRLEPRDLHYPQDIDSIPKSRLVYQKRFNDQDVPPTSEVVDHNKIEVPKI